MGSAPRIARYYTRGMRATLRVGVLVLAACGGGGGGDDDGDDDGVTPDAAIVAPTCDPLPQTATPVIPVDPSSNLAQVIFDAPAGSTIEFADGTYDVSGDVVMNVSKPMTLVGA